MELPLSLVLGIYWMAIKTITLRSSRSAPIIYCIIQCSPISWITNTVHYIMNTPIPDNCPSEEEILVAVERLRNGKAPGPSRLKAEDEKLWAEKWGENPEP
jgi:hypothetical protein